MDELTDILQGAVSAIEPAYFQLKIDGGDPKYRERVYCYELYHQMRMRWPNTSPFYLNGEVDKAAHPILKTLGVGKVKPDLLVHQPGYMQGNHAIIEVKSQRANSRGIKKDLETLSLFVEQVKYKRAIYLLYGPDASKAAGRVEHIYSQKDLAPIELWIHREARKEATIQHLLSRESD